MRDLETSKGPFDISGFIKEEEIVDDEHLETTNGPFRISGLMKVIEIVKEEAFGDIEWTI